MVEFQNIKLDVEDVRETDIFICAIGYEARSQYILKKIIQKICAHNILVFCFEGFEKNEDVKKYLESLDKDILQIKKDYLDGNEVREEIIKFLKEHYVLGSHIHIDYSSMPRNWYFRLPMDPYLLEKKDVFFWYVVGKYPVSYEAYPSAGIEAYSVIGRPSLRMKQKRLHVIGLGYDTIRTKALISILDPDMYSVCAAFGGGDKEIDENVHRANSQIIGQAVSEISFHMEDFSFMVAKLCEIASEYLPLGDIVFVPDGPKPLIMAMSLVPLVLKKEGVTCLHVSRNNKCYEPVKVDATETILGFAVKTI